MDAAFVGQGVRIAVPYLFAALGGTLSERSGVINIALEGMMLAGAFGYVAGTHASGSPWVGLVWAIAGGVLVGALHALLTIWFLTQQIVTGVAINLLVLGITDFALKLAYGSASNSPRVGSFEHGWANPLVWVAVMSVPVLHLVLSRTRFGLHLRAVGDNPLAAETVGISVRRMRLAGVLLSGALAALGGAHLASEQSLFTSGMTAGRGYIALAAMIVGKWRPVGAALAALFFGFTEAIEIRLQASAGFSLPPSIVQIFPYVATLLVLCGLIGRARAPVALGVPYEPERR
jgi:simple sugar transport system permease protein